MPRIAKKDAAATLDRIGKNIVDAAGKDGVVSRRDVKKALVDLASPTERALTDRFYRFIDHRDFKIGARITRADVERAVAYAEEHLLANYDVKPRNGYSWSEMAKMSVTGRLTLKLTAELKGVKLPPPATPSSDLGKAIAKAAENTYYVSESDSQPELVQAPFRKDKAITPNAVMAAFKDHIKKAFEDDVNAPVDLAIEAFSARASREFLPGLADASDAQDDYHRDNAAGFARIKKVFDDNLTDVRVFKVGPRDEDDPGALATDQGAYRYLVLGRTADGKLAGVSFESVET